VAFIAVNTPRGGANNSAIVEFLVDDTEAVYRRLVAVFGNDLDVVQPPTMMPWGNLSVLIRDPDGALINLYTPVTPQGQRLQRNRTPRMLPSEA
jgi:catechol 2,3-dioxygenase-like lactoylglutathione lyase family enzyme